MNLINSILIIRLSSMGDVLLTTAFVRQLRKKFPLARIDFLVNKKFSESLKFNPHITNLYEYDKEKISPLFEEIKKSLPNGKYDIVIDLQKNLRSLKFRQLGKKIFSIKKDRWKKIFLVKFKWNFYNKIIPIAEKYRRTAVSLGVEDDGLGLELWLPEEKNFYPAHERSFSAKENFTPQKIAIAPGAHHFTKRWPPKKYAQLIPQLIENYSAEIFLLGGPADKPICEKILSGIPEKFREKIFDKSGTTSVFDTARILDQSELLITNDTGVMHIAAARKIPVIAIFGSTVKEFGFAPYRTPYAIAEKDLPCRPCTHIGRSECPLGHFKCMNDILPEEIVKKIKILAENLHD